MASAALAAESLVAARVAVGAEIARAPAASSGRVKREVMLRPVGAMDTSWGARTDVGPRVDGFAPPGRTGGAV